MKVSGLVAGSSTMLWVLERTDNVAKVYAVDLAAATNIAGTAWDDPATSPSLEGLPDPAAAGVKVLPKTLVVDLSTIAGMPKKVEGIAMINLTTLAVINDNDFGVGKVDPATGDLIGSGLEAQLLVISLDAAPVQLPRTGGLSTLIVALAGLAMLGLGAIARRRTA
jgi:LPXTG-motif cell wall-anchored protein